MANDTDYKKLWRTSQEEVVRLHNLLFEANERITAQADLITKIREGIIKPEDILKKEKK